MLAKRPDGHLIETGQCEQGGWQRVGHRGERHPGQNLVGVVRTGDKGEQLRKRIRGWERDAAFLRASGTQIAQRQMDTEVAKFGQLKCPTETSEENKQIYMCLEYGIT